MLSGHQKNLEKSENWYFEILSVFLVFQCSVQSEVKKSTLCKVGFNPREMRFNEPPMLLFNL